MNNDQWIRRIELIIFNQNEAIDLSEFRVVFRTSDADIESPNSAWIRIYNLSLDTMAKIQQEYSEITLNAGYLHGNYGVIFQGVIKYFVSGKENNVSRFLDLYCSDGDIFYNQQVANRTFAKGTTPFDKIKTLASDAGIQLDAFDLKKDRQFVPSLRGSVEFGMSRARFRNIATTLDASWSIHDGKLIMMDNTGYRENDVIELNSLTGMIGIPEQTPEGIKVRCLLNSRLRIGGAIKLTNDQINQLNFQSKTQAARYYGDKPQPITPYDQYAGDFPVAPLSAKGFYRMFVVEHEGDSRGQQWYSNIIGLAITAGEPADQSVDRR